MLVFHHTPRALKRGSSPWYVSKTRWGALSAHGTVCEPTLWNDLPHVPNVDKLRDQNNNIVRIPENHINEIAEFICMYCPPDGVLFDACAGTLTTLLASMYLNRQCVVNERD